MPITRFRTGQNSLILDGSGLFLGCSSIINYWEDSLPAVGIINAGLFGDVRSASSWISEPSKTLFPSNKRSYSVHGRGSLRWWHAFCIKLEINLSFDISMCNGFFEFTSRTQTPVVIFKVLLMTKKMTNCPFKLYYQERFYETSVSSKPPIFDGLI